MDADLKQYLEGMETRLTERVDATETRIMQRVDGRIDAVEDRLKDFIRQADLDLETKIVGEFWKWGRTSDMRTKQALDTASAVSDRLLSIEDRVSALERKSH
jgi:hypothetical protein